MNNKFEQLIKLRKDKGLTQEELGNFLGVKKNTVSDWEKGRTEPNITMINKLADYFKISTDKLLGREEFEYQKTYQSYALARGQEEIPKPDIFTAEDIREIKELLKKQQQENKKG